MSDERAVPEMKWRQDFPYESERDDHITRRDFTRFLLLVSAGFAAGNGWIWGKALMADEADAHAPLDVCAVDELEPGTWRVFHYPDEHHPAILIRRVSGEFIAFHQKCTHLACPVAYERQGEREEIVCHCHNGKFDVASGKGTAGPPRELRPLPRVALLVENGRIMAVGVEKEGEHA
jgi:nitrite reductase/ring-hydroxylating ferredoxin subunit